MGPRWEPCREKCSRAASTTSGPSFLTSAGNCRAARGSGRIRRPSWRSGPVMRGGSSRVCPRWEARCEKCSHAASAMSRPSCLTSAGNRRAVPDSGCVRRPPSRDGLVARGGWSRVCPRWEACCEKCSHSAAATSRPSSLTSIGNRRASPDPGHVWVPALPEWLVAQGGSSRVCLRWEPRREKRSHAASATLRPNSLTSSGNRRVSLGSGFGWYLLCWAGLVARGGSSRVRIRWGPGRGKRSHAAVPTSCTARTFGRGVRAAWV
jgi:hypothetical protein